jgi:hypothetical protein
MGHLRRSLSVEDPSGSTLAQSRPPVADDSYSGTVSRRQADNRQKTRFDQNLWSRRNCSGLPSGS